MEKVIVITKFLPAPAFSGGAVRSRAWIKFLSRYYDLILIGFWEKKFGESRKSELLEFSNEIYGFDFVRTKSSLIKTALRAIKNKQAIVLQQYYLFEIQQKVNEIISKQDIRLIFCEELSTMQYIKNINNIPIIFDDHNIEYEIQERSIKNGALFMKPIIKREALYVKRFERFAWEKAKLCYFVSERDRQIASHMLAKNSFHVVENTFSSRGIIPRTCSEWFINPTCVFIGNMSWKPNHYGLMRFLKNVYPMVKEKIEECNLILLGSAVPDDIREYAEMNKIEIIENVEEKEKIDVLSKCWLAIAPVYYGSGTRIKILEYWAHAKTVLSTTIGAEGLHKSEGTFIQDSDEETAKKMIELLDNKQLLEEFGKQNNAYYEQYYKEEMVYADSLYFALSAQLNEQN